MTDENKKSESRSFWPFPKSRSPFSFFENIEDDWSLQEFTNPTGLGVSEDDKHIFVEASLPGIVPEEIEMVFDKGILWIKADKKEEVENKKKKYYRKAMDSFSYRIAVPGDIDESIEPDAICKNGILKVTFHKTETGKSKSKKISIREG